MVAYFYNTSEADMVNSSLHFTEVPSLMIGDLTVANFRFTGSATRHKVKMHL